MSTTFVLATLIASSDFFHSIKVCGQPIAPSYDKFCISGSIAPSVVEGIYEYYYWNKSANAVVYYNKQIDQYLFPWSYSPTLKYWLIGNDPTVYGGDSYCSFSVPSSTYIINPMNCTSTWNTKINAQWTDDPNMRSVNCNNICITGSNKEYLHGVYIWLHYNVSMDRSVYYCQKLGVFLYHSYTDWKTYNGSIWETHSNSDSININKCNVTCKDGIKTVYYGFLGTKEAATFINHGEIKEIISWSIYVPSLGVDGFLNQTMGNLQVKGNDGIISEPMGDGGSGQSWSHCTPFIVDTDDYINGYRVIYDRYIYGLTFYTEKHKNYSCPNQSYPSNHQDSGIVIYTDSYLSGLYVHAGWIIDVISFQFMSINNCTTSTPTTHPTLSPIIQPTNQPITAAPTIYPTNNPTTNPTSTPSTKPTSNPISTVNPTNYPSSNPTSNPTSIPTMDPTSNPSSNPTSNPTLIPTPDPTSNPTIQPTVNPTAYPSSDPTIDPTSNPSLLPTRNPTMDPVTLKPTASPIRTDEPTRDPTSNPSLLPTTNPTMNPITSNDGQVSDETTATPTNTPQYEVEKQDKNNEEASGSMMKMIIFIIIGFVLIMILIVVFVIMYKRKHKKAKRNMDKISSVVNTSNKINTEIEMQQQRNHGSVQQAVDHNVNMKSNIVAASNLTSMESEDIKFSNSMSTVGDMNEKKENEDKTPDEEDDDSDNSDLWDQNNVQTTMGGTDQGNQPY